MASVRHNSSCPPPPRLQGGRCCSEVKMMKDDGPSPRVRISLTGAFHRPRQFEHEITGPTETRVVACAEMPQDG